MKRSVALKPTFNATNKTLDFSGYAGFNISNLYAVINVTRNTAIYIPGVSGYGLASLVGSVLTLQYDTTTFNNADTLNVIYEAEDHGKYYEANIRNEVYSTFINGLTIATGHVSPIAAGTGTPIISIHNPAASGKKFSMMRIVHTTESGTPGGPLLLNIIPNPGNISATSGNPYNNNTLAQSGSSARIFNNTAITGSTVGTAFRTLGGPTTSAAAAGVYTLTELFDGNLIIPAGSMLAVAATAAGTSHVVSVYAEWEEIPV